MLPPNRARTFFQTSLSHSLSKNPLGATESHSTPAFAILFAADFCAFPTNNFYIPVALSN